MVVMQSVLDVGRMQVTLGVFPGRLEILNDFIEIDNGVFRSLMVRVDDLVSFDGWWLNQDYSSVMSLIGGW